MSEEKRIGKILKAIKDRVQEEVKILLGADFAISGAETALLSKEDIFDELAGKQICARMDILAGENKAKGCLLIGIKDAIRLGGTLIMLPDSELEEFVGREDYSEEIEDSYGEIANIIAGSFTKDFEEMHPKGYRFVRKEQEILLPVKIEPESDEPVPNTVYYRVIFTMTLEGNALGSMVMLMPGEFFGLDISGIEAAKTEPVADESVEECFEGEQQKPETGETAPSDLIEPKKIDVKKHKARIDRLLEECQKRLQTEVSELLGTTVRFTELDNYFTTKEEFFDNHIDGKHVIADMEAVGDSQGMSYFVASLADAINLGGVLIMLPPNELGAAVTKEDFSEDIEDAYGEVANIVSGVYTAIFEENYIEKLRFIKKKLTTVVPVKVEAEGDEPIINCRYYVSRLQIAIEENELGSVHMLFPVELLQLEDFFTEDEKGFEPKKDPVEFRERDAIDGEKNGPSFGSGGARAGDSRADLEKRQKKVDKLLAICRKKMEEEVTALLGTDVRFSGMENRVITKEEFFEEQVVGKQVFANMEVAGDLEGMSYFSVDIKDAIRIGGVLIMLPSSELENAVTNDDFSDDTRDAYGEIANIVAGVYTEIFEDQYSKKLRFIRREVCDVSPLKVDIDSDEPMPSQKYYLNSLKLEINGDSCSRVNFLVPLEIFDLLGLDSPVDNYDTDASDDYDAVSSSAGVVSANALDILLIGDDEIEADKIKVTLEKRGYRVKLLSFKDNIHNYLPGDLKAVYLVTRTVNELAFGTAIKVSSSCSFPIVAAGPGWTRSMVIKAAKYGISDILLTPASEETIEVNVNNNLLKKAA